VIQAAGHTPGSAHHENEIKATCTTAGGYDTVIRCKVCDSVISTEHTDEGALGHAWGEWTVTTPAQIGIAGEETRVCQNDPSHVETRPIDPLPIPEHTVTVYLLCRGNGNGGGEYSQITELNHISGTGVGDVTVTWDWNRYTAITADGGDASFTVDYPDYQTYETTDGIEYRLDNGIPRGKRQHVVLHNITKDEIVYITISNNRYSGVINNELRSLEFSGSVNANFSRSYKKSAGLLRAGNDRSGTSMTQEQLDTILNGILSKDQVSCAETEGVVHTYKELVDTYTITQNQQGDWTWSASGLPKYNEYGNEYTYYVKEINMPEGYEITYIGQDDGLKDQGTAEIHNKKQKGSLLITKNVLYNGRTAATEEEKAFVNGEYTFTVKKGDTEIQGSPFTITVTDGVSNSILIPDLEEGNDYSIQESNSGNLILQSASGGTDVTNNIVTATVTAGKLTETELLDSAKAVFTNNCISYDVTIIKVDVGDFDTKLGGAVFDLYSEDAVEDGQIKADAVPIRSQLVSSSEEGDKGKIALGCLTAGKYYLHETTAPSGYVLMDGLVEIIVSEGRVSLTQGSRSEVETIAQSQENAELTVTNSAGVVLPHTGGSGRPYPDWRCRRSSSPPASDR